MLRRFVRTLVVGVSVTAVALSLSVSGVFAGEITGNGTLLTVNGNSPCAYSGQEDLQWYTTNDDTTGVTNPVKGDPAHSQNWGHVKQATGLTGGANSVPLAEWGCNGNLYGLK